MRIDGNTVRQIAERLRCSVSTAHEYLRTTLEELRNCSTESAESWRLLQLHRLDDVVATWLPVSRDPTHPEATRAAAIVVRAVEAQSRLLGLLQPVSEMPVTLEKGPALEEALRGSPALVEAMERALAKTRAIVHA